MRGTYTHVLVLIGAVMVSMLASSAGRVKPKTEIGICCVSAKHAALKTGWLGIRIMCLSWETCLSADCYYSELALLKSNKACWSSTEWTSSSSHCKLICSYHDS